MNYISTNLKFSEDVMKELKSKAIKEKKTVSQLIREAVQNFLVVQKESVDYNADPFNNIIGMAKSGTADGSTMHDHYLYGKKR